MRRTAALLTNQSAELWQWVRHFGDFVTIPVAIVIFASLGGVARLPLVVVGLAGWTLVEYLMHRFAFHRVPLGKRLHQLHHDHPADQDAERSSLTTPLAASPFAVVVLGGFGLDDGSAIFAGLLAGYLVFIAVHHAVHRWPIGPRSPLYAIKLRHMTHHRQETCNFGVTTAVWDVVFRTQAKPLRRETSPSDRR